MRNRSVLIGFFLVLSLLVASGRAVDATTTHGREDVSLWQNGVGASLTSAPRLGWQAGPALPAPRSNAVAVVGNNDIIYVLGGSVSGNARTVHRLVPGDTGWSTAAKLDRDRVSPGAGTSGSGRLIVFGGLEEEALKSTIEYNIYGDHQDLQDMSVSRYNLAYARDGVGRLYAIGGMDKSRQLLASVERYDHTSNTWTTLAPLPEPRYAFSAAFDGQGHIFTFGGGTVDSRTSFSATVNQYDIATNAWSRAADMPIATRDSAAVLGPDGLIYVIGGRSGSGVLDRVLVYDPAGDSWSEETALPAAVRSPAVVVAQERLMVIGGTDASGSPVASVWVSQPLNAPDVAPVIISAPVTSATVGVPYSYQIIATGNPPPSFLLRSGPAGMTIDAATGLIQWTPAADQVGSHNVRVWAYNRAGQAEQIFTIDVSGTPPDTQAPSIPTGLTASDVTQTTITLTWNAATDNVGVAGYRLYEYVRFNPFSSQWVLRVDNIGAETTTVSGLEPGSTHQYAVTAFDAAGNESERSATLEVRNLQPPTAYHPSSGSNESVYAIVGELFTYDVDATGVPIPTFSLVDGPAGMSVDTISGVVMWTPAPGDVGGVTAVVRTSNSEGFDDHVFSFPVYPAGTDLEPPSQVWNIVATNITTHGATLSWDPATDNVGVAGYYIMAQKDGRGNATFTAGDSVGAGTTFTVISLEPDTGYRLWVAAYDAAGNVASISGIPGVHITTLAATSASSFYFSPAEDNSLPVGSVAGVADEDILGFDGADFTVVFDGSDVGIEGVDLDAFTFVDADTILMSFDKRISITGLGTVDDSDIVQFDATSLGSDTAGSFSRFFDGSNVGLDTNNEDIDAIALLPDGRLLMSTTGRARVSGISARDEDIIAFMPASPGDYTTGTWAMYFDGSDVGRGENINGVAVAANGDIYLTTKDDFVIAGTPGGNEDVYVCTPSSLGFRTACGYASAVYFDGSAFGLADNNLDAVSLP